MFEIEPADKDSPIQGMDVLVAGEQLIVVTEPQLLAKPNTQLSKQKNTSEQLIAVTEPQLSTISNILPAKQQRIRAADGCHGVPRALG